MGQDVASVLPDYLEIFMGVCDVEEGLPFPERIERDQLDLSLDSLRALNRYLDHLHIHAVEIEDQQFTNVVLAAGSYLGEVIRKHSDEGCQWINYEEYFLTRPELTNLIPENLGTAAVLVTRSGRMAMPLNKIIRYIDEGPENCTHWFAIGFIRPTSAESKT